MADGGLGDVVPVGEAMFKGAGVAGLGLDPVYARHQMGLARWECGVELE